MEISLNGYKVVYGDKVLNALSLSSIHVKAPETEGEYKETTIKPDFLGVLAVDTDGTLVIIEDEARKFQFIPRIN